MFKKIKRAWKLASKEPKALEKLTDEQIDLIPEIGDGNAVFFGEGSHEEWEELKKEDAGMKPWYERLNNL